MNSDVIAPFVAHLSCWNAHLFYPPRFSRVSSNSPIKPIKFTVNGGYLSNSVFPSLWLPPLPLLSDDAPAISLSFLAGLISNF